MKIKRAAFLIKYNIFLHNLHRDVKITRKNGALRIVVNGHNVFVKFWTPIQFEGQKD